MTYPSHLIPTTVVGSYPQPDWLVDRGLLEHHGVPRVQASDIWRIPEKWREQAQDDATIVAIGEMERAGIDIVTDGEIRRESYSNRFALALDGIDAEHPGRVGRSGGGTTPVPRVVGKIRRRGPVETRDAEFLLAHATRATKITLPGPFTLSQQAENAFYSDEEEMAMDYAAAVNEELRALKATGVDVVQLDEPWVRTAPEKAARWGVKAINRALDGITGPTIVHLCFGYAAMVRGKPSEYAFLPQLADTAAGQISIEAAQPRLDLGVLKDLSGKTVLLGVLDLNDPAVETAETVAARLRAGLAHIAPERLVAAPDCGMKYLPRAVAIRQIAGARRRRRDRPPRADGRLSRAAIGTRQFAAGCRAGKALAASRRNRDIDRNAPANRPANRSKAALMSDLYLRSGIFLAPFHNHDENPTLSIERDLELLEHLDRLNYHEAWIGEHHSGGFELIACPEMFIAAAAQRTRHIRLGTGVVSLPYHNPFMVADRMVQLDHMTRGRAMFGMGPGALVHDALKIGIDPGDQRQMMNEALDVIVPLLRGETVNRKTDWFNLTDAQLQLRPLLAADIWSWRWRRRARRRDRWPPANTASACCRSAAPRRRRWSATPRTGTSTRRPRAPTATSPTARTGASSAFSISPTRASRRAKTCSSACRPSPIISATSRPSRSSRPTWRTRSNG